MKNVVENDQLARERAVRHLGLTALLLWAASTYRQSLPYPFYGAMWAGLLSLVCLVSGWLVALEKPLTRAEALALAACWTFALWYVVRWAVAGAPAVGADNVITVIVWCGWVFAGATLSRLLQSIGLTETPDAKESRFGHPLDWALAMLGLLGAMYASHAALQYFVLYDQHLAELQASIGNRAPTPLEMGLLHHFRIKRVASIWGDPNALGGFCALAVGAWWYLGRRAALVRWRMLIRLAAWGGAAFCVGAIILSRSRGALLDLIAMTLILLALRLRARRWPSGLATLPFLAILFLGTADQHGSADAPSRARWWRSDTVQERFHYAQVGWGILKKNPVFGAGPGCVEVHFGQLKTSEARESKYLHNWALQIAAEVGLIGLLLYAAALGSVGARLWSQRRAFPLQTSFLLALIGAFLVDSSIQLSFNQRELMATFGGLCGLAVGLGAPTPQAAKYSGAWNGTIAWMSVALALGLALIAVPRSMTLGFRQIAQDALEGQDLHLARTYLEKALRWQDDDHGSFVMLAAASAQSGDLAGAERALRRAIEIAPWSASCHAQLAEILEQEGRLHEAEQTLRRALRLYPTKAEYWRQLAEFLERRGRIAEAAQAAKRAAELSYLTPERDRALYERLSTLAGAKETTAPNP